MFFKLSNNAESGDISKFLDKKFRFPKLHQPALIINGNDEVTLPIVTMADKDTINYGLWGILPYGYEDDWNTFQRVSNTLNIDDSICNKSSWLNDALQNRRCLIVVTGYFTTFIKDNKIFHHFVHSKKGNPFLIAGVYNETDDGYFTFTIILCNARSFIREIHNLDETMILSINNSYINLWLDEKTSMAEIKYVIQKPAPTELATHSISRVLLDQEISYNSMLEPFAYEGVPFSSSDSEEH